ncbi:hypothetical protein LGM75_24735 [Burkholderia multivorans]|uniref:hypothetical protein n=1 Tax=Burkholderia multivorans TaxID=87883 RepID=UPI001C23BC3B|nr:hypothetical protein [Burkholderia multivorans]MBU9420608.1 hypothetical protein [Burkholderia multivorans]MBU9468627.1 hypothetical protein [Burkholderia multivorans]MCA8129563.1 hypothetical protein [Burkholderia multivorans]
MVQLSNEEYAALVGERDAMRRTVESVRQHLWEFYADRRDNPLHNAYEETRAVLEQYRA